MRTSLRKKLAAITMALATGGLLAALSPANPAVAFFSPPLFLEVEIESPAQLVSRGAAVDVTLEVTCTSADAVVFVSVSQRVGNRVASGSGSEDIGCTRSGERLLVRVLASAQGRAFERGDAVVNAQVFGCVPEFCGSEDDTETVQLRR
jgi:hypothetical protein